MNDELCEIPRLSLVKISIMPLQSQPQQTLKFQKIDDDAPKPSYELRETPKPLYQKKKKKEIPMPFFFPDEV